MSDEATEQLCAENKNTQPRSRHTIRGRFLFFGSNQVLNGNQYFIESEYSNKLHSCTDRVPTI